MKSASSRSTSWLDAALEELAGIDEEIAEEVWPPICASHREAAGRVLEQLAEAVDNPPFVYPNAEGELSIDFADPSALVLLLDEERMEVYYSHESGTAVRDFKAPFDGLVEFIRELK